MNLVNVGVSVSVLGLMPKGVEIQYFFILHVRDRACFVRLYGEIIPEL